MPNMNGPLIRDLLRREALTREDFAAMAEVSVGVVDKALAGKSIGATSHEKLANALRIPTALLVESSGITADQLVQDNSGIYSLLSSAVPEPLARNENACRILLILGSATGQAWNLYGEILNTGGTQIMSDVIQALDECGLSTSEHGQKILTAVELIANGHDEQVSPLEFQAFFRDLSPLLEKRFRNEYRWFQLGQFSYMIPTVYCLSDDRESMRPYIAVLMSFSTESWLPSGLRELVARFCAAASDKSAPPTELFGLANQICLAAYTLCGLQQDSSL